MVQSTRWRVRATGSATVIVASLLMLAGCGSKEQAAAGNDVEMRDMEVVDGTANDAMTDLDAVQADGVGIGNNAAGNASAARVPDTRATPEPAKDNSEAVASE